MWIKIQDELINLDKIYKIYQTGPVLTFCSDTTKVSHTMSSEENADAILTAIALDLRKHQGSRLECDRIYQNSFRMSE